MSAMNDKRSAAHTRRTIGFATKTAMSVVLVAVLAAGCGTDETPTDPAPSNEAATAPAPAVTPDGTSTSTSTSTSYLSDIVTTTLETLASLVEQHADADRTTDDSPATTPSTQPSRDVPPPTTEPAPERPPVLAQQIVCCDLEYVGTTVAAGRYVTSGAACEYDLNLGWIVPIAGGQVVVDLRDGDRIRTNCTLRPGSGATGTVRGPGTHVNVPAGNYVTDQRCIMLFVGSSLLRAGTGSAVFPDDAGIYALPGGTVSIDAECGGIRPA